MRLMGVIIAVLLAAAAGIATIPGPHAAVSGVWSAVSASVEGHGDHVHPDADVSHDNQSHEHASARTDCERPISGAPQGTADCCAMSACHAIQAFAAPVIHTPFGSAVSVAVEADKQVEEIILGDLDKPPRTV